MSRFSIRTHTKTNSKSVGLWEMVSLSEEMCVCVCVTRYLRYIYRFLLV